MSFIQGVGDLFDSWFLLIFRGQLIPDLQSLISQIPQGSGHSYRIVVAQIPTDFTDNHGDGIGRELHIQFDVEIVHGLNQPDTAHLEKVIHIFASAGKALDDGQDQAQISVDQPTPGLLISCRRALQKLFFFFLPQSFQSRRMDSAKIHL